MSWLRVASWLELLVSNFEYFRNGDGRIDHTVSLWEFGQQLQAGVYFICCYADNAPPAEPQDVRAHLSEGIPKAEVEAKRELLAAHGFDPTRILVEQS